MKLKLAISKFDAAVFTLIIIVSIIINYQLLFLRDIPDTPMVDQDFSKHLAYIMNFYDAFVDGQILPRLQLLPSTLPSLPIFQFYGTLLGFITIPFLLLKLNPLLALALGLITIKAIGGMALYLSCKLYNHNGNICLTSTISYLLSPYILSNVLGRMDFPEATAHGTIPILFYGLIRIILKQDFQGILVTSLSVLLLALAHPIFLEYGVFFAFVFLVISSPNKNIFYLGFFALLIGAMISAFQWYPAFLEKDNFSAPFIEDSPFYRGNLSSMKGLFWFADSLADRKISIEDRLFLTPGILTLPALVIILSLKTKTRLSIGLLGVLMISLILSFAFFDIWTFLPKFTWALQFPYRILSFVALFTSLAICSIPNHRANYIAFLLIFVVFLQAYPILVQPFPSLPLFPLTKKDFKEVYANKYYSYVPNRQILDEISSKITIKKEQSIYIQSNMVETLYAKGYERIYKLPKIKAGVKYAYTELPIAFSRLFSVEQGTLSLSSIPSINSLTLVRTNNFSTSIKVIYAPPIISTILSVLGLLILVYSYCVKNKLLQQLK